MAVPRPFLRHLRWLGLDRCLTCDLWLVTGDLLNASKFGVIGCAKRWECITTTYSVEYQLFAGLESRAVRSTTPNLTLLATHVQYASLNHSPKPPPALLLSFAFFTSSRLFLFLPLISFSQIGSDDTKLLAGRTHYEKRKKSNSPTRPSPQGYRVMHLHRQS
jgi:hypothetical protein